MNGITKKSALEITKKKDSWSYGWQELYSETRNANITKIRK